MVPVLLQKVQNGSSIIQSVMDLCMIEAMSTFCKADLEVNSLK